MTANRVTRVGSSGVLAPLLGAGLSITYAAEPKSKVGGALSLLGRWSATLEGERVR